MLSVKWLLLLLAVVASHGEEAANNIRLPKSIIPEHYRVGIIPDVHDTGTIEGFVHLDFFVQSSTDKIIMHAKNLTIIEESVFISTLPTKSIQENGVSKTNSNLVNQNPNIPKAHLPILYDTEKEFVIIQLTSKLDENFNYRVSFSYKGSLAKNLKGFYRSEYMDRKTKAKK